MTQNGKAETEPLEGLEEERPMPKEVLDSPEMKAKIAKAKARARQGRTGPGKTADDLLNLAREQRGVDSRT